MLNEKSLKEKYPEVAAMWHPTKNGELTPDKVSCKSNRIAHWIYEYDDESTGKHFVFEWSQAISAIVRSPGCIFLKAGYDFANDPFGFSVTAQDGSVEST